jgi:uncharacterized Ntn-hydrolase superfamily protein
MKITRLLLAPLVVLPLFARPADATWSIVCIDRATGEVAVASATCLAFLDLAQYVPVVRVGVGAGAAQSLIDTFATNRQIMWNDFIAGDDPAKILNDLLTIGTSPQGRQYGIAGMAGPPATHTGSNNGLAATGVAGSIGTIDYAIQGNVLTDDAVVFAAETAFRGATGDLGQRIMAGMQAAKSLGGDGRCSCTTGAPTSCGAPPPSFTHSAYIGFVIVARVGDTDGAACTRAGCAEGVYYLNIEVQDGPADPDPVDSLQILYDAWRVGLAGRPDHVLSTVDAGALRLPADGLTSTPVTVRLVDVDGAPLSTGGATVTVATADGSTPFATPSAVVDNGDGSYTFTLTAGVAAGSDSFVIQADDGTVTATLFPHLDVEVDPAQPLHAGFDVISAAAGETVPFTADLGAGAAGDVYVLLASASGTVPGAPVGGVWLPLNPDWLLLESAAQAGGALLPGSLGVLDAAGRAGAAFVAPSGLLTPLIGLRFDWALLHLGAGGPATLGVTNAVGFDIGS